MITGVKEMIKKESVKKFIGEDVEKVVETHMSVIYLGYSSVAKEIKEVDLGFVNLRPIEVRRIAAKKTAEIDAAYCPDLGSRAAEIDGTPVIIMRRFDSSQGLDRLYDEGRVTVEHGRQIGNLFARAHQRARTDIEVADIAYRGIFANFEELFVVSRDVAQAIGKTITEEDYLVIVERVRVFMSDNLTFFIKRRDDGLMRQCHGDGHAGNMFVEGGEVKIFDGIGFKDEFSFMDTVSDLAFSVMDALARGRRDVAEAIKASYISARPEDAEGVEKLLGFYICYRAFVRGQINTMIGNGLVGEEQEKAFQAARNYYKLALEYCPRD